MVRCEADVHSPCQCGSLQKPWMQTRVHAVSNVLLVQVPRFDDRGERNNFPIEPEEELYLPGLDTLELYGVVYHEGATYSCACRGPDWKFWHFNNEGRPISEKGFVWREKTPRRSRDHASSSPHDNPLEHRPPNASV